MADSSTTPMHIADLQSLITRDPGRPRLTWYGDDGERIELSGAVLHNWISKTVNLLVEEFDAGPGARVLLDVPPHWRSVVWALATWRTGATLVLPEDAPSDDLGAVDVVVTTRPHAWVGHDAPLVAVPLPALARRFEGTLPPGAVDAGSAVMTYGDQIGWVQEIDPGRAAIEPGAVPHGDLLVRATASVADPVARGARVLVPAHGPLLSVLVDVLSVLAVDGSVVLLASDGADDARTAQVVAAERVSVIRPAVGPTR